MRKHDLELIAALAEGTLEDESEARALVESSEEHRAEYEAQKTAIEALRSAPKAHLTDSERASLRRDVWTELTSQPTATPKTPWYYRWAFGGAAVLVVAVGLLAVLNQGASDEATTGFDEVSEQLAGDGDGDGERFQTEDTIQAADSAEEAMEPLDDAAAGLEQVAPNLDNLTKLAGEARSGVLQFSDLTAADGAGTDQLRQSMQSCVDAALEDHEAIGDIEAENHYILAIPEGVVMGPDTPVAFVDVATCELVHIEE